MIQPPFIETPPCAWMDIDTNQDALFEFHETRSRPTWAEINWCTFCGVLWSQDKILIPKEAVACPFIRRFKAKEQTSTP